MQRPPHPIPYPWDLHIGGCDDPRNLTRIGVGLRAVSNRDPLVAATCPCCGHRPGDGLEGEVRLVEAIETYRPVVLAKPGEDSVLVADNGYETGEGYDDGVPGTMVFECHGCPDGKWCGERWEAPGWLFAWDATDVHDGAAPPIVYESALR